MNRFHVIDCIDDEREYQDKIWGNPSDVDYKKYPISQFTVDFDIHLNKLKQLVYDLDNKSSMDEIRKIGALAIKCGEVHGMSPRTEPKECI